MLIDWFTVVAQMINFLVLVLILRWFLFDRIRAVMARRQDHIAGQFEEAERLERRAREAAATQEAEVRRLREQHQQRLDAVSVDVARSRTQLLDELRGEVAQTRTDWQEGLRRQRRRLLAELQGQVGDAAEAVSRAALASLAGADLEERIIEVFLGRLAELDDQQQRDLSHGFSEAGRVEVRSSFDPSPETSQCITDAIRAHFDWHGRIDFHQDPQLGCGIELRAAGRTLAWTLDQFLGTAHAAFEELLDEELGHQSTLDTSSNQPDGILVGGDG